MLIITRKLTEFALKQPWNYIRVSFATKSTIPKNTAETTISAHKQPDNGTIYDKKPLKINLEAGKKYVWCLCGYSHTQPFCDGTHRNQQLRIKQKPVVFKVEETKDYWLCNCKQTGHRPFCDGTHKEARIQEANTIVR